MIFDIGWDSCGVWKIYLNDYSKEEGIKKFLLKLCLVMFVFFLVVYVIWFIEVNVYLKEEGDDYCY